MSTTTQPASPPQLPATPLPSVVRKPLPEARPKAAPPRRRLLWFLVSAVAATALLGWFGLRWLFGRGDKAAEILATATRADLPITVSERGELESSETVSVACEVEGYQNKIIEILPEGTEVDKGQVVVRFDQEELKRKFMDQEVKYRQAVGKEKAAKGELEVQRNKADKDVKTAERDFKLAVLERDKYLDNEGDYKAEYEEKQGDVELAKRNLEEAKDKLEHYRTFVKKGFGTPEQLRLRELEVARYEYELKSKKAKLLVLTKFTRRQKEVELTSKADEAQREVERCRRSGNAAVEKAEADWKAAEVTARLEKTTLDHLQKQLDACIVNAPQKGIVVYSKERFWDPTAKIQLGAMVHFKQPIFSLPNLKKMQVKVKIHESLIKKVKPGQKADIQVESYPNAALHGEVVDVATMADSRGYWDERGVKEYVTTVKINDLPADADLKPGMSAQVKILANHLANVLVVPVQAVAETEGKHYSYLRGGKGIERREVTVGENNEKFVEIKEGLEEGERVTLDARARRAAEAKASEEKNNQPPKPSTPPTSKQPEPSKQPAPTVAKSAEPATSAPPAPASGGR